MSLRYSVDGALARFVLNRPDKRNALDRETVAELASAFSDAEHDDNVRVILLSGAGKDFCAGADLAQVAQIVASGSVTDNLDDAALLGALFMQMRALPKPIIAA